MERRHRVKALWIALAGSVILSAVIVPLWVTADSGQANFTATLYSDVIRFEADGVASLRVTTYDLAENELWNSALVMGDFVDWDRSNARGERLANGLYLYLAQGWDSADVLILNKTGKVVLLPGDQVELRAAPVVGVVDDAAGIGDWPVTTKGLSDTGIFKDVGIGISPPQRILHISHDHFPYTHMTNDQSGHTGTDGITLGLRDAPNAGYIRLRENWPFQIWTNDAIRMTVAANGYVGIGIDTPGRILHIHDQHFSYAHMTNSASGTSGTDGLSLGLRDAPDAGYIRLRENWPFDIYTNNLQRLRVAANGNVGIGTTTPSQKLDVAGDINMTGFLYRNGTTLVHNDATNYNTFVGRAAGNLTMSGGQNTGVGDSVLSSLTSGNGNTALGENALLLTTTGHFNTAVGDDAMFSNVGGEDNTAVGDDVLVANIEGDANTAVGKNALEDNVNDNNTAVGYNALLDLSSGSSNTALGHTAGQYCTNGSHNVYISNGGTNESNTTRIGDGNQTRTFISGIYGVAIAGGTQVVVDANGQLGNGSISSRAAKRNIANIGASSRFLYDLRPVSFLYREEIDPVGIPQYGLIAEEVAEVAPELVVTDEVGDPMMVRYELLAPLLLNELQEQRELIETQQSRIDTLLERLEALEQEVRD